MNVKPKNDFVIRESPGRLPAGPVPGWRIGILHHGRSDALDDLMVHVGVLDGGASPHAPHCHNHEELFLPLSDGIAIILAEKGSSEGQPFVLARGSLCFIDSLEPHTLLNTGADPASYLHVRWRNENAAAGGRTGLRFIHPGPGAAESRPDGKFGRTAESTIYAGPTRYVSRLIVKMIVVAPEGGVANRGPGDETVLALVEGTPEILGRKVHAPGFAFLSRRVPCRLVNPGPAAAVIYAAEFQGPS